MTKRLMTFAFLLVLIAPLAHSQTCWTCYGQSGTTAPIMECVSAPYDQQTVGKTECSNHGFFDHCFLTGSDCMTYIPPGGNGGSGNDNAVGDPADYSTSPVVIKLSEGPWALGKTPDVAFDFDGDGVPERVTWTAADTNVAFLVLDRDGDGQIAWNEIFGNRNNPYGHNGFQYLGTWDENHDGVISALDTVFSHLQVWRDINRDAHVQPGELQSLADVGITALMLDYNMTRREDRDGNAFRYMAHLIRNGHVEPYCDVYFGAAK